MTPIKDQILVSGATGQIGRHLVADLLAAAGPVRALTRSPGTADLPDLVEVVAGEFTNLPVGVFEGV